jgi:DNA-binding MarR family transcriptional regulator
MAKNDYVLEKQIGHVLRRAHQRASAIFMANFAEHGQTPTQFAALAKIRDHGEVSQNHLGRLTAMDPATMKGVIGRLHKRRVISRKADPADGRRTLWRLTASGEQCWTEPLPWARRPRMQPSDRSGPRSAKPCLTYCLD